MIPGSIIPLINKNNEDNRVNTHIITIIGINFVLSSSYYIYLKFIYYYICTFKIKAINNIRGINPEVKVTIIDFKDKGPVIIFLLL